MLHSSGLPTSYAHSQPYYIQYVEIVDSRPKSTHLLFLRVEEHKNDYFNEFISSLKID